LLPERTGDSMRNFLKVQLKMGLLEYYKEHVGSSKYAHAFNTILRVKPATQAPVLNKEEK
jgi:hypothetical protein